MIESVRSMTHAVCVGCAALALAISPARGDEPAPWLTGEKFRDQLGQKVGVTWSGLPLRKALNSLSRSQHVAILLDRRVDPDQKIELSFDDLTLDAALKLIAERKSMGMAIVGAVVYLGPAECSAKIRTVAALRKEEAMRLPSTVRTRYLQQRPAKWDELAEPQALLKALGSECKIAIEGTDKIPHDLWGAADLPPANFIDRLTLIAAQFDLTFEIAEGGESVRLTAVPQTVAIQHVYPLRGELQRRSAEIVQKLSKALPEAKIEFAAGELTVRGHAEDLEFTEALLSGGAAKKTTVMPGKKVYQLTIVMPVGQLIAKLGEKLDLEVRTDTAAISAAGLSLKTEVKVDVKNVSVDELLSAVLAPAGLTFQRQGRTITVVPRQAP